MKFVVSTKETGSVHPADGVAVVIDLVGRWVTPSVYKNFAHPIRLLEVLQHHIGPHRKSPKVRFSEQGRDIGRYTSPPGRYRFVKELDPGPRPAVEEGFQLVYRKLTGSSWVAILIDE